MKNLYHSFLLILLNVILVSLSACEQDHVDPQVEADLNESVFFINSYLVRQEEFEVYIYRQFTYNQNDYILKTTNRQIYFHDHRLIVNPEKQSFEISKFRLLRSEQPAGENQNDEFNKIKRLEIYFNTK